MWIFIVIAIILILAVIVIGMYNKMVASRLKVKNAWAQIDIELKRRFDLIDNLVETVKAYSTHEKETLEKVINARNNYTTSSSIEEKANASNMLTQTLKNLFSLTENYPDLKANQNFMHLQNELSETEDKIAYSRQFYNDAVQKYNLAIMTFPTNIFAKMLGFKEEAFFKIEDSQKEAVKVKF